MAEENFSPDRLQQERLITDARDALKLQVSSAGEVYFIERAGVLRRWSPHTRTSNTLGTVACDVLAAGRLIGLILAPDFTVSRQLSLLYSREAPKPVMRLVRFTLSDGRLDAASEHVLLEYPTEVSHCGGGMQFDAKSDLWICTSDHSSANVTPETDQHPGKEVFAALRTTTNSQDLRGKALRIHPHSDDTYTTPAGNFFDKAVGRAEIYVMGCRNPYRLTVDDHTSALHWGEVGSNTKERFGTGGFDEVNRTTSPSNFSWPHSIGPNTAYRHCDHARNTHGELYEATASRDDSRTNTGMKDLPPARPAWI